ncbi:MAG: hypothetical protein ACTTJ3_01840 [Treponema sp.]
MANIEKDTLVLKRKLDKFNEELQTSYKRIGKKLLLSIDEVKHVSINEELVSSYNGMLEERSLLTNNILEIKSSHERLTQLYKFKKQILKSIKEADSSISKLKIRFSISFYRSFKELSYFTTLDNEIEKVEEEIEELLSSTQTLDEEKKDASFLGKFNINRKIAGNKFKVSLLKKNIERRLCKHSNDIFEAEEVSNIFNEGKMTDEQVHLYKAISEEEMSKKDLDKRISDIEEEETFLLEKMQTLCENNSHVKQISNLNTQIKKIDEAVDEVLKTVAIDFVAPFLDDSLERTENSAEYCDDIQEIKDLKLQIQTINYNIEYCNLNLKKDSISTKITYMNKAIENCEKEIKNYEERIEKLKEDIETSNEEKQDITEELSKLEALIKEGK